MKKIMFVVVAVLIVLTTIFFGYRYIQSSKEKDTFTTVRVSEVTRSVFYAPQYVAIAKDFFAKENIKVELTTGQGADKVMTAVLAGQSDIGFAGPEASIYVYNEGKEDYTQVIAQMTKKDGSFLVSKTKQEEFKWSNVKGSTIIPGRKGGVPYMTFEYVLKKNKIEIGKDVILDDSIKFDLMAGAFSGGTAEYVTLFEPTASMTQNAGKGYIVASIGEASGEIPYTAYFAKKSYLEKNAPIVQNFVNAVAKGQKWVMEHSAKEIADAIVSFFPDTEIDLLESVIQRYKTIDVWNLTPVLKEESFDLLQTVMKEAGELKSMAPYDKVVNNSFANKAIK